MSCGVGLHTWLGSHVAVAVVQSSSYSSSSSPSLGTSISRRCSPKKKKKKKKHRKGSIAERLFITACGPQKGHDEKDGILDVEYVVCLIGFGLPSVLRFLVWWE